MNEGPLPAGWAWTTLGELGRWCGGGTPSKRNPDFWEGGSIPWLSPKDMGDSVLADTQDHITKAAVSGSATSLINANSVAIVVRSGILERKVPVALVPFATTLNQDMKAIVSSSAVDPKWLLYTVQSQEQRILHACRKDGTTVASLDTAKLQALPIPLPPLAEQHRIVEALEDHLSRLDAAERTLQSIAPRTDSLSNVLLDDAILGRSKDEPLTASPAADLRGKHDRFQYRNLPALPQDWQWALAADLCVSVNSGSTPPAELMQQDDGEVPFLKVYNIDPAGHIDFTKNPTFVSSDTHRNRLRRSIALPGDVVTNIVGPPLGKSAIVPSTYPEWNTNQAIVAFRAGPEIEPDWLAACLRAPFIVELLKSTARATAGQFNIALSTCRELPLPVPPIDTQRRILEELTELQADLRHAGSVRAAGLTRSSALRRALLRAAFSGELVDQNPADESAAVALTKLREERPIQPKRTRRRTATAD